MHKHAVAVAAQKKRNRLVHVFVLGAHAVARIDHDVLAALV